MTTRTKKEYIQGLRGNARKRGDECLLTESDLDILLSVAGIAMADIGRGSQQYHLARYNDTGNYEMGNCRFITAAENHAERVISESQLESMRRPRGPLSEEQRALRRVPCTEERKRNISAATKGIPKTEEHKRKIGLAHKGRPSPHKGKKDSAELKQKKSLAAKLRWERKKAGAS